MFSTCVATLGERKPSAAVLIDYPGFNLRFARKARAAGVPVVYYISPQVWAWGKDRAAKMKPLVNHLAVVFPFEETLFREAGIPTTFVGHPLLFRGQMVGVLAVFFRVRPDESSLEWLRTFAAHAAVAIGNCRAFQEIERLRGGGFGV